jgi:amidase
LSEYASYDALGLSELVANREVTPRELAQTAARAIEIGNPYINAVVEVYPDRVEQPERVKLGSGAFYGVPLLIKDDVGHEKGRKIEFGSRLCKGMVGDRDTHLAKLLRASGVNILGRSNAPEYAMAGTTENALYGNTSTPWRQGYSAGGSTGGGMAAVVAGMVPMAHGSDIGGSIRIPASWCGGVGLKPSRGRISAGPWVDEHGFGMSTDFVQTMTVRDAASMLDCLAIPQPGDPFLIPKPTEAYAEILHKRTRRLKIGWSLSSLLGVAVDSEVASVVEKTSQILAEMGHEVFEESPQFGGEEALRPVIDLWFFGFDQRLEEHARRNGRVIGPETLEPVTLELYAYAKTMTPHQLVTALERWNALRCRLGSLFRRCDVWLTPTTPSVAEPWGRYNPGRADITVDTLIDQMFKVPCQFTVPHNIMGTPAISLPLGQHTSGLPIGIQLGGRPAQEHVLLQLALALERAMPWRVRVAPLNVSRLLARK